MDEDPATGETLAVCALASREDVNAAVAAARAAQPGWAALDPAKRARILHELARLIEEHKDELAETESRDVGKPLSEATTRDLPFTIGTWEYYAGWPTKILGTTNPAAPGCLHRDDPRAARRLCGHHAVELPAHDRLVEDRAGAGLRQHGRPQARSRRRRSPRCGSPSSPWKRASRRAC